MGSFYEVRGKSLKLHKAMVTRTINGLGHLRGKLDEDSEVLDGDFVLQFASQEGNNQTKILYSVLDTVYEIPSNHVSIEAQTVYELMNN